MESQGPSEKKMGPLILFFFSDWGERCGAERGIKRNLGLELNRILGLEYLQLLDSGLRNRCLWQQNHASATRTRYINTTRNLCSFKEEKESLGWDVTKKRGSSNLMDPLHCFLGR